MGAFGTIAKGVLAGMVGTVAMDLVWWSRSRRSGSDASFVEWDLSTPKVHRFEDASAPGQVGKKVAGALGIDLPEESAGLVTDVVHWATGSGYGLGHAMLNSERNPIVGGLLTGAGAWLNSYAMLGALGVYEPMWKYDTETLAKDLTAHLAFGLGASLAYAAMDGDRRPDGRRSSRW